jgi:predicted alpha/beta superfamily hydrolase
MSKNVFLTLWLLTPLAIVVALGLAVDREAAKKSRERVAQARTAALLASASGQPAAEAAKAADAAPAAKMVRPESLEQGFVLVVKDAAGLASANSPIYLAGSHNGWDPSDRTQILTPRSDLRWQIVVPKLKSDAGLAFKFTRGNWDTCEVSDALADIDNRSLPMVDASKLAPGEKPIFEFVVPKWADQRPNSAARPDLDPYYTISATGTVRRVQVAGGGVPALRDVLVWLPPGYEDEANKDRRYPVLYLQDGQNIFMKMPTAPGEWGADETATKLIEAGKVEPMIIVAMPNSGRGRMSEYSPFPIVNDAAPRGREYVQWLTSEVMPRIDRAFRTKTGPANTAIGGSSLGAVIALYAAQSRSDVFGSVLAESLPLTNADGAVATYFSTQSAWPSRLFLGVGGKEFDTPEASKRLVIATQALEAAIKSKSASTKVALAVDPAGEHNELAWSERFGRALEFLFAKP